MSSVGKNLMVGLTMLFGLVLLGVLLLKFGAAPASLFGPQRMPVELLVARADGLSSGSNVNYLGISIGQVTGVHQSADATEVIIDAAIDVKNAPPENVQGRIRSQIVGGGSSVSLEIPDGEKPHGRLKPNAKIATVFLGVDLLPPEFAQLANELRATSRQLRESKLVEHLDATILTVNTELQKAGKLVDTLDNTVHDAKIQDNLRASLESVRSATANLNKFSVNLDKLGQNFTEVTHNANMTITSARAHVDDLSKQMDSRMLQLAKVLDQIQSITSKIDQGKGTAGLLINDGKLYEGLVDASKELTLTLKDMKLLIEQSREEGIYINLGKK